jgi:hypothetical protein
MDLEDIRLSMGGKRWSAIHSKMCAYMRYAVTLWNSSGYVKSAWESMCHELDLIVELTRIGKWSCVHILEVAHGT